MSKSLSLLSYVQVHSLKNGRYSVIQTRKDSYVGNFYADLIVQFNVHVSSSLLQKIFLLK